MPRPLTIPDLPKTPGGWLACYRYRTLAPNGMHYSPENLAREMGVSGDTIRRWESGLAKPTHADLSHLADVCRLDPVELEFLAVAFGERRIERPPKRDEFYRFTEDLLSQDFPAFIFDSLFYFRAANSYNEILKLALTKVAHSIDFQFGPTIPIFDNPSRVIRKEQRVKEFWFHTAGFCGSPEYIETIVHLESNPEFSQYWRTLALEGPRDNLIIGSPSYFSYEELGTFRIETSLVSLPPSYFVCEFVPVDDLAWERVREARRVGPPVIHRWPQVHWADDSAIQE